MSIRDGYDIWMVRYNNMKSHGGGLNLDQYKRYMKPFKMFGNLYYVGDNWVCGHLVDTGDGLILFDAGHSATTGMLVNSIWEAGFNPRDVKWLILSHGHVDHIGCSRFMRGMFGTKIYLGEPDSRMFREHPEFSFIQGGVDMGDTVVEPDTEINDGDIIRFGNTEIKFALVPGHTAGCIACFFDVTDGKEVKHAGYYGGFGFNTLAKEHLIEYGDPELIMRNTYLDSLAKVRNEPVDIFMANHTNNGDVLGKRAYMLEHSGENPFVDNTAWGKYLDFKRDELHKFMADPANS